MSIEDINFLKKNSFKQSYTFLVDSADRNRRVFPEPSEYAVEFTVPFKNVIGLEVLDVSIPKTMYNIDYNNNKLYFYISDTEENNYITVIKNENGEDTYDPSIFTLIEIPPADYTTTTLIDKIRVLFLNNGINLDMSAIDTPPESTNLILFKSTVPFILDMHRSTIAEVLGFDTHCKTSEPSKYTFNADYNEREGFEKLYHSVLNDVGLYVVKSPGMMYILGYKYILMKCPEIEQHLYRSLSYSKYNLGLAKIRVNSYGYNDEKTSFLKVPLREFHPIGKLPKITLRFETNTGELYNFKGVNHNIVFAIYYYEPKQENVVTNSILNPDYNPNMIEYLYTQEEQEGESDEDEIDYSRDDTMTYKRQEQKYTTEGIQNEDKRIAYELKKKEEQKNLSYQNLLENVRKNFSSSDEYDSSDSS